MPAELMFPRFPYCVPYEAACRSSIYSDVVVVILRRVCRLIYPRDLGLRCPLLISVISGLQPVASGVVLHQVLLSPDSSTEHQEVTVYQWQACV